MVTAPPKINKNAGRAIRLAIGLALFALYAGSAFLLHSFGDLWMRIYFVFLILILIWSLANKKIEVLMGFLAGTVIAVLWAGTSFSMVDL